MYIVGLVEDPKHVCCRYRLAAFKPYLEAEGHRLELRSVPRGFWARFQLWRSLRGADAVILQRRLLAGFHLMLLRRHARRLLFDFDDAVFRRDSYSSKKNHDTYRLRRFTATMHAADVIVAGNEFLRQEAARFASKSRIRVVPTCVEPRDYQLAYHARQGGDVQLVWIGSASTLQGLERQRPLLDAIAKDLRGLQCKVICDRFPHFKRLHVLPRPWAQETEAYELATADIGISWVPEDRWSQGKCGLKVLQYMAAGLPVVANPVGVQAHLVRHGENGFLASTPKQWQEAITRLAADPDLRQRLGRAGRRLVERHFSVARGAALWLEILQSLSPSRTKAAA